MATREDERILIGITIIDKSELHLKSVELATSKSFNFR